jgi:hypothetical protein
MAVLGLHPQQQKLPEQQLLACYATAVAARQQQQQQQCVGQVAALHPARRAHMQQCRAYLQQLSACLTQLGLTQHQVSDGIRSTALDHILLSATICMIQEVMP